MIDERHLGLDIEILIKRKEIYEEAKLRHPSRWNNRKTRNGDRSGQSIITKKHLFYMQIQRQDIQVVIINLKWMS